MSEKIQEQTKECPKCKTQVNAKATKCPNCQSDLRNWFRRHPVISIILAILLLLIIIPKSGDSEKSSSNVGTSSIAQKANETSDESNSSTEENSEFKVGDVVNMRDWVITVNSVTKAKTKGYSTAKAGKEYVFVNVTLKNNGEGEAKGTGSLDFKVQDSNGVQDSRTYVSLDDEMQGIVNLAPGGVLKGTIPFEVPENDNSLKLIFQPNFWLDSQRVVVNLQ